MTEVPPLFIQTAGYEAANDRLLIGGVAYPAGDPINFPRPRDGIRPQGTDVNKQETSLMVSSANSGTTVKIHPGSAFVGGASAAGMDGIYFVSLPTEISFSAGAVTPNVSKVRKIVLTVLDPMVTGSPTGTTLWEIVAMDVGTATPQCSLILAEVVIPGTAGQAITITDKRRYTTTHGGMLLVGSKSTDIDNAGALTNAPYGSIAYASADRQPYIKTSRGWSRWPVNVLTEQLAPLNPTEGELYFNSGTKTLWVYQGGEWIQLTYGIPPQVAMNTETTYPASQYQRVVKSLYKTFTVKCTNARTFNQISSGNLVDVSGQPAKPTNSKEMEVKAKINAANGLVAVTVSARVHVKNPSDAYGGLAAIAVDYQTASAWGNAGDVNWQDDFDPAADAPLPDPVIGWDQGIGHAGISWAGNGENMKSRTIFYWLAKGEHIFRPNFAVDVANSTMEIGHVSIEVATL